MIAHPLNNFTQISYKTRNNQKSRMSSVSDCSFIKSASGSEQNCSLSSAMVIFKELGLHNLFNSVHVMFKCWRVVKCVYFLAYQSI